jgi:uncharacterized protein (DUF1684 family)
MKILLKIIFAIFLSGTISPSLAQVSADSAISYAESLENFRKGKNIKLMYSESSPLTIEQKQGFEGLKYFPADIKYLLQAKLVKAEEQETILMKTSTDRTPQYIKYGYLHFQLDTFNMKLAVFQNKKLLDLKTEENILFVPFRDETTGEETYGGGRYVDCEIPASGNMVILDFNKAYNPYCAYNARFSCVVPPDENRLPVPIKAGEKIFEEH